MKRHKDKIKIIPYSVKEREFVSIAEESARLFYLDISKGAKGEKKHNKREQSSLTKKHIYHVIKRMMYFKRDLSRNLRDYLVRDHMLDFLDATIYMSIRNWESEKLCSEKILVPVHNENVLSNAPGNLVLHKHTNHALHRTNRVSTGKFSRVKTTGFLYKQLKKRRQPAQH